MDETEIKHVVEAALLAAGKPLTLDRLGDLFAAKGGGPDRITLKRVLDALAKDYAGRSIELKEVATGYRIQIKHSVSDWLQPLWEERAPRYTRALLETLALIAYRQPITRAEIEEVRGVVVSTNIIRTLLERNWVRVVGHRDVPGKPAMFGSTKEFLDYFGLKKLEDLPPLEDLKDGFPELSPQADLIETLEADARGVQRIDSEGQSIPDESVDSLAAIRSPVAGDGATVIEFDDEDDDGAATELDGPDLVNAQGEAADSGGALAGDDAPDEPDPAIEGADVIPLRAGPRGE